MQPIKVINGDRDGWVGATRIYIGRLNRSRGLLKSSPLANPYRIGKDGSRKAVVEKYRLWLNAEIEKGMRGEYSKAFEELKQIRDKIVAGEKIELSCYCAPALCHGDVIKEQVEKMAALQLKTRAERDRLLQAQQSTHPASETTMNWVQQDLLSIERGVIVQQVNCRKVMGKGLALAIRSKWPQVFDAYRQKQWQLGDVQLVQVSDAPLYVCNLAGQDGYGTDKRYTDYDALRIGLRRVQAWTIKANLPLHIPAGIGCKLGGGNWETVQDIIQEECPGAIICTKEQVKDRAVVTGVSRPVEGDTNMATSSFSQQQSWLQENLPPAPDVAKYKGQLIDNSQKPTQQQVSQLPYNPLANLKPLSSAVAPHQKKDVAMAEVATQFIGFSAAPEGIPSSTRNYQQAWGDHANTGVYSAIDTVMVSGSGFWRGVTLAQIESTFKTQYVPLLDKAINEGASFVVGNAKGTDRLVQRYLEQRGYRLSAHKDGYTQCTPELLKQQSDSLPTAKHPQQVLNIALTGSQPASQPELEQAKNQLKRLIERAADRAVELGYNKITYNIGMTAGIEQWVSDICYQLASNRKDIEVEVAFRHERDQYIADALSGVDDVLIAIHNGLDEKTQNCLNYALNQQKAILTYNPTTDKFTKLGKWFVCEQSPQPSIAQVTVKNPSNLDYER